MNILIIDDDQTTTNVLQTMVNWNKFSFDEILVANSASEAKQIVYSPKSVDIIICDIEMPIQDGLSLIREFRSNNIEFICLFLTAYAEFRYAKQAIELDSIDYILKPFSIEDIEEKIQNAVNIYNNRVQNNVFIKYGKLWAESNPTFTQSQQEALLNPETQKNFKEIHAAKSYMQSHYADIITLEDIASASHLTPNYLCSVFKKSEGVSVIEYLTKIRIHQAKVLLSNRQFHIGQIASMTGFDSISYFNKVFKKSTGLSPSQFRKQLN